MIPQITSLNSHKQISSSFLPNQTQKNPLSFFNSTFSIRPTPSKLAFKSLRCSASVSSETAHLQSSTYPNGSKPFPAEVSRTIMEMSSGGTLSTLTDDGWPLGIGVKFAVDGEGTPVLCFNATDRPFSVGKRSSLHVQLNQCGVRTSQCTIQGSLDKPKDEIFLKRLLSTWKNRFGEEIDEDFVHVVSVDRILQMEDFQEDGVWISPSDYVNAEPDPLREFAERIVEDINKHNKEDVLRFCNIYADLDFRVSEAKMVWVDRLGFDVRVYSPENGVFEIRIPFPRQVSDEKGLKSSFNGMSQIAWEVEKNYYTPDFSRVKDFKQIASSGQLELQSLIS